MNECSVEMKWLWILFSHAKQVAGLKIHFSDIKKKTQTTLLTCKSQNRRQMLGRCFRKKFGNHVRKVKHGPIRPHNRIGHHKYVGSWKFICARNWACSCFTFIGENRWYLGKLHLEIINGKIFALKKDAFARIEWRRKKRSTANRIGSNKSIEHWRAGQIAIR